MPKVPEITSLQYLCNISRKRRGINIIFCMKIHVKVFYKRVVSFLLVLARHVQSTQNSKFAISLQYLEKKKKRKGGMKLIFCLQINMKLSYKLITLILVDMVRPSRIIQNNKFAKTLQYLKKEVRIKLIFCEDKHHIFL